MKIEEILKYKDFPPGYKSLNMEDKPQYNDPLWNCVMSNVCEQMKLYGKKETFDQLWTSSLFPERISECVIRIIHEYVSQTTGINQIQGEIKPQNSLKDKTTNNI